MAEPFPGGLGTPLIRVAVIDDHRLILDGLAARLSEPSTGIAVVAVEPTWAGLLASAEFPVDVVVLDLHLEDNIPIGTKLRALAPTGSATVVMSQHTDQASVAAALAAGALGFVAKTETADELIAAIHAAAASERHLSSGLAQSVAEYTPAPDAGLGPRELNALILYAGGRSIREVAAAMRTTEETVKSYIKRARRKYKDVGIDVGTRILLRRHGVREGWISQK
jgi:two-component system, NarL family, uhpT operon response regulator UhpA